MTITVSSRPGAFPGIAPTLVLTGSGTGALQATMNGTAVSVTLDGQSLYASNDTQFAGIDASAVTGVQLSLSDTVSNAVLTGSSGDDSLSGGAGNDTLIGGSGRDTLVGGDGYDQVNIPGFAYTDNLSSVLAPASDNSGSLILTYSNVNGAGQRVFSQVQLSGVEQVNFTGSQFFIQEGTASADTLIASNATGSSFLSGGAGNDTLTGSNFGDIIYGGDGDDVISGGGGYGRDVLSGGAGNDSITGSMSDDTLNGGSGSDTLIGNGGDDLVIHDHVAGSSVGVAITVTDGSITTSQGEVDTLTGIKYVSVVGGSGNDTITGSSRAETLVGGAGADLIDGGAGNDVIIGGAGDTLTGGAGNDRFNIITAQGGTAGITQITDFATGDRLSLLASDGITNLALTSLKQGTGTGVTSGQVEWEAVQGGYRFHIGTDTVAGADHIIDMMGAYDPGAFVLTGGELSYIPATNIVITGSSEIAYGGNYNDTIVGGGYGSSIYAGGGDDQITVPSGRSANIDAGSGNDTITAIGSATITGGEGSDTYRVGLSGSSFSTNYVTINDFAVGDKIEIIGFTPQKVIAGANYYSGYTSRPSFDAGSLVVNQLANKSGLLLSVYTSNSFPSAMITLENVSDYNGLRFSADGKLIYQPTSVAGQVLTGTNGADTLTGGDGPDTINGGNGRDLIRGGGGNDVIDGGTGNDVIHAGPGLNRVDGGAGVDTLVLKANYADILINVDNNGNLQIGDMNYFGDGTVYTKNVEVLHLNDRVLLLNNYTSWIDHSVKLTGTTFYQGPSVSDGPFNEAFYLSANPDVAAAVSAGLLSSGQQHYDLYGRVEGRMPSAPMFSPGQIGFDEKLYLATNPDVAQAVSAGVLKNAYQHYYLYGQYEGRDPNALFDSNWYLAHNPDVAAAVASGSLRSAAQHYAQYGAGEGRDPSASFDVSAYLAANPDLVAAGVNPAFHYMQYGIAEGRVAVPAIQDFWG
ncbi:hypothetical protein [Niveispirillum sp. BGYR6]|uniref:beta strand repeat-containing protein n=1 Tax=Niveispirillum sp. BGYR6 TaxID=2971249 RepID=UPI0022B948E6|nr:hypothetical protein [Niveispirillum sp. BGYR6]MDG5494640.1 hypothetical protein [Niveispirillum sp. BGYR6]